MIKPSPGQVPGRKDRGFLFNLGPQMKFHKLNTGNYFGYYFGYYFFAYKKAHGGWCCRIGKSGEWLYSEGVHGTSLPTVKKVKWWVKEMLTNPKFKTRIVWDKIWKGTENAKLIPR